MITYLIIIWHWPCAHWVWDPGKNNPATIPALMKEISTSQNISTEDTLSLKSQELYSSIVRIQERRDHKQLRIFCGISSSETNMLLWVERSPGKDTEDLSPRTSECDIIWKQSLQGSNQIKIRSLQWVLHYSPCKKAKSGNRDRHAQKTMWRHWRRPCEDQGLEWRIYKT